MSEFGHTTAKIAARNLAGFNAPNAARIKRQIDGLALLDAEVVTLVEVNPVGLLDTIKQGLADKVCIYDSVMLPQNSDLNIGVLFKQGAEATNP